MKLNIIVLASGESKRFNGNKLLHLIDNKPMYKHMADKMQSIKNTCKYVNRVIFVTKYNEIKNNLIDYNLEVIINNNSNLGISQSVKLGVIFSQEADAYMFIVCDQPYIKEKTIIEFIENFVKCDKNLGCISYKEKLRNPTIFSNKYKDKLLEISGDSGGKKIIKDNIEDCYIYEVKKFLEVKDIDYKEDLN